MNSERTVSKAYAKRRTFHETNETPIWYDLSEVKIVCWIRRWTYDPSNQSTESVQIAILAERG